MRHAKTKYITKVFLNLHERSFMPEIGFKVLNLEAHVKRHLLAYMWQLIISSERLIRFFPQCHCGTEGKT